MKLTDEMVEAAWRVLSDTCIGDIGDSAIRAALEAALSAAPPNAAAREVAALVGGVAPAEDDGWRSIETAPKDGTLILLARLELECADDELPLDAGTVGHWATWADRKGWYLTGFGIRLPNGVYSAGDGALDDNGHEQLGPTHWMPLPAAPAIRARGER